MSHRALGLDRRTRPGADPGLFPAYAEALGRHPLLSTDEERDLARKVKAGDAAARDRMISSNLRLVVNIARHYTGRGLAMDDLIQWGNLGLLRAAELFDPGREPYIKFCTYATYWVRQSIRWGIRDHGRIIRIPAYLQELMVKIQAGKPIRLTSRQAKNVAAGFEIWDLTRRRDGHDPGETGYTLPELLTAPGKAHEDATAESEECRQAVRRLEDLNWREAAVIRLRFGLVPATRPHTLQEISKAIGVSKQRVQQIEAEALENLRRAMSA